MSKITETKHAPRPYELFMLILSIIALGAMATNTFVPINDDSKTILEWSDTFLCAIFFIDFLISFYRAPKRWRYLMTWGWIDLLSSIPTVDILRWGRVARVLRVFRLLRAVKVAKVVTAFILNKRGESAFLAATLLSILLVTFSSVAILQFEQPIDSNIKGPGDALWWSVVTLTTVGYGDRFPVTAEGRIIGVLLMVAGVGLFGTLSGFIASWFLTPTQKKEQGDLELLRSEISTLRETVSKLCAKDLTVQLTHPQHKGDNLLYNERLDQKEG